MKCDEYVTKTIKDGRGTRTVRRRCKRRAMDGETKCYGHLDELSYAGDVRLGPGNYGRIGRLLVPADAVSAVRTAEREYERAQHAVARMPTNTPAEQEQLINAEALKAKRALARARQIERKKVLATRLHVMRTLKGEIQPSWGFAQRLAAACGVTLDELAKHLATEDVEKELREIVKRRKSAA